MLELIFQGFAEWLYDLVLEAWEYFASAILDVMSLDFAYLESHIPAITSIRQVLLAGGWALLIGNLVFQAIRSMVVGLGFEGEDPKLLFTRSFVFSFLLFACPQICDLCLDMTSMLMQALEVPSAVDVHLVDSSVFGSLSVSWLLIIIFNIIIMFQVFKLLVEVAERYVILGVLTMVAPMAFGVGGSKSTADIFTGWCRMYGSMCFLMVSHVIFLKMLLSVLSAVPSGLDTFLWMILVLSIVKVAKKADSIITRIGLNPAFTGDALHTVPGALSYVLLRQATAQITKSLGKATGGTGRGRSSGFGPSGWGPRSGGPRGTGNSGGTSYTYNNPSTATNSATSSNPSSASEVASSVASTSNNTTSAPLLAPVRANPSPPGSKPPDIPPDGGPVIPCSPTPGSPGSQSQKTRIQLQNGQGRGHPSDHKAGMGPHTQGKPSVASGIPTSPGLSSNPADMPRSGTPGLPGKTGTADPSTSTHSSGSAGQAPTTQVGKPSVQTAQRRRDNVPSKPATGQPTRAVQHPHSTVTEKTDPGSAVTTQERGSEARFSHRESRTSGRTSSLTLQSTQATRERPSQGTKETSSQGTRFTVRSGDTGTPGGSGRPGSPGTPGTHGSPGSDNIRQEHISRSETKSTQQATRQSIRDVSGTAKVPPSPVTRPTPPDRSMGEATTSHPGTAGKPTPPPMVSASPSIRQGRNSTPAPAEPSRTPDVSSTATQERRPGGATPIPVTDPAPRPSHGTAGMGAPSIAPSPDRAPRHSRNEISMPSSALTHITAPIPARQESRPPVPAQPRSTAPTLRSGPGIAETAHLPGQTASPVQTVTPPTQPAASAQPVRPGGQMTAPAQPVMRQSFPAAKVTPAVKATPAPTDTRYKKGYPAKSTKGGRKRHGR